MVMQETLRHPQGWLRSWNEARRQRSEGRRLLEELGALDDRGLDDIGLSRFQLDRLVVRTHTGIGTCLYRMLGQPTDEAPGVRPSALFRR